MENENKAPSTQQNTEQKKFDNRKKFHKPKPYFMTPANNAPQTNQEAQQKDKAQTTPQVQKNHKNANSTEADKPKANNENEQKVANQPSQSNNHHQGKNKKKNKKGNSDFSKDHSFQQKTESKEQLTTPNASHNERSKSDRLERPAPKKLEKFADSSDFEKYSDYEEFTYEQLYGDATLAIKSAPQITDAENSTVTTAEETASVESNSSEPMVDVVGIKFKESGKTYYFDPNGVTLKYGQHAIVKTARGLEYGDVVISNTRVKESETVPPLRPVVRVANEADNKHHEENKAKEDSAFHVCNEKIIAHKLDMKLIDAQYTFDNSKLLFYFTSSGRVDFRDLVKDLASVFKTRIELRQVGIRDEAKMVGGFGPCGRALCCTLFLTDFGQVSIKMAKEQSLSLNSAKISGICGRLMCCLRYESETYDYEIKRTPPVDTVVRTVDGVGVVTEISPLVGTIKVRLNASPEIPPKSYKREEVSILKKKQ